MAVSHNASATLADGAVFQQRIAMAVVKQALVVMAEGAVVPNHAERVTLARLALGTPSQIALRFAASVATVATITASSTDAELDAQVVSQWNAHAGVG